MDSTASQLKESSFDETLERCKFMRDEVFMLTLMAVVQRGQIYAPECTRKEEFPLTLRERLEQMAEDYRVPITEEVHLRISLPLLIRFLIPVRNSFTLEGSASEVRRRRLIYFSNTYGAWARSRNLLTARSIGESS